MRVNTALAKDMEGDGCCEYKNLHKTYMKHLNCKLYYQQLHLKYWCNLAGY
jgi:hypothetical protein